MWRLANGTTVPAHGALLPPGYQPHPDIERPWICPIRSCRTIFEHLHSLGGHFNSKHRAARLNDNGDGTFSVLGFRIGRGRLPAIVVSQRPLDPEEHSMARPALPSQQKGPQDTVASSKRPEAAPGTTDLDLAKSTSTSTIENSAALDEVAIWTWKNTIHPHLQDTPVSPIPARGHVQDLLPLKRVRGISFNPLGPKFFESRPQDISALIIQLTGNKAIVPCKRCQQGKGPFAGCFVISPDAPLHVRRLVTSCANCFYKGNQTYCGELAKWHRKTYPELKESGVPATVGASPPRMTRSNSGDAKPIASDNHPPKTRKSSNVSSAASTAEKGTPSKNPKPPISAETRQLRRKKSPSETQSGAQVANTTLRIPAIEREKDQSLQLSMEDWEIAPGRIRNVSLDTVENIAFSAAYLAHGEEVSVAPDVGFHVLSIKPGGTHRFKAATDRMRLCSIARGKVKVKMLEEQFEIGPNGMFQVKSNTACVVENRIYGDATLHVSVMPDEFMT
ncbi:hypothetical protein JX265_010425 [Neoarthrinium moseri]|uniref:C2H2-type domain-containing protein n=1 Tax=Neoarthrinium moseri TaxID=1658444 RepID=A0A9P9WEL2_9PEZI|nr:hypothetical protein JX266_012813 [Neoarthrinium moseri]KAI1859422.1 hypothetical protein JX265_010425 [Neoarthrinium moseri]